MRSAQTTWCQWFIFSRKRNNNPGNIWDWKYLSMLPVDEGQDKEVLRSEEWNQRSDQRVMMQSFRRWWVKGGGRLYLFLKSSHQVRKRKKALSFSLRECSISLWSATTFWGHCRSCIPQWSSGKKICNMAPPLYIVITTNRFYEFEYRMQFYKTVNHMEFYKGPFCLNPWMILVFKLYYGLNKAEKLSSLIPYEDVTDF